MSPTVNLWEGFLLRRVERVTGLSWFNHDQDWFLFEGSPFAFLKINLGKMFAALQLQARILCGPCAGRTVGGARKVIVGGVSGSSSSSARSSTSSTSTTREYNAADVEKKWNTTVRAAAPSVDDDGGDGATADNSMYILSMFPYPR